MGCVTVEEGRDWQGWLDELQAAGRVVRDGDRLFAAEASRDPKSVLRGRLEALGPVQADSPRLGPDAASLLVALEADGAVLRTRIDGREAWCDRRLLARIQRYTLDRLRREIEPVTAAQFLRFLACWQHVDPEHQLEGPRGVGRGRAAARRFRGARARVGGERPPRARARLPARVARPGDAVGRSRRGFGSGARRPRGRCAARPWPSCRARTCRPGFRSRRSRVLRSPPKGRRSRWRRCSPSAARSSIRSCCAPRALPPAYLDLNLAELVTRGRATCDSFAGLRWLMVPAWRRSGSSGASGRWSVVRRPEPAGADAAEFVARQMLRRTGVVFRRTLGREKQPVPWRDVARACRRLEARGELRGGRFVAGFDGEQYALPEAVTLLRAVRKRGEKATPASVSAAGPAELPRHPYARRARLPGDPDARRGRLTRPPISGGGGGAARAARGPGGPWCPARAPVRFPCRTRPSTRRRWSRWCR